MGKTEENKIKADDVNYAIYKIGDWDNDYEINQVGLSSEIPVTENTMDHVKLSMDEIRRAEFEIDNKTVNGSVAIAFQLNSKIQEMDLADAIELEQKEFDNITEELANVELMDNDDEISLDSKDYLIYKLEKECHVTKSIPANDFTKKYHDMEIKKIEDALN